jgi:carbonic anhydrase
MIDYVFRYDPTHVGEKPSPTTPDEARLALMQGNRVFSEWMTTCREGDPTRGASQYIVPCAGLDSSVLRPEAGYPVQKPFAAVLGCSDARVPTEMLFGQGFNDLFVVRVAGNVLGDEVQGTIDFSVVALSESVRVLVSLGHTNCGAVKGAVEAYLDPKQFWSKSHSPSLRLIFQRIFVAVRESDNALREVWGPDAPTQPGYRSTLMDMAVCLNAAHTAFSLRQQIEAASIWNVDVLFGVYDVRTHQVCMPIHPLEAFSPENVNLALAPGHPRELQALARELATSLRPRAEARTNGGSPAGLTRTTRPSAPGKDDGAARGQAPPQ